MLDSRDPSLALGALFLAVAIVVFPGGPALGQQEEEGEQEAEAAEEVADEEPEARYGRHRFGIAASYGVGVEINGSIEIDVASLWVRWTRVLGGEQILSGERTFLGGQPAAGIEITPLTRFDQDDVTYGAGWHFLYEHRLRPTRPVRPTVRLGAGMIFTNHPVPPGETRYNFTLFAGAGLEIDAGERTAVQIDYRLHHVSNADTGPRNPGINAHTVVFAVVRSF